MEGTGAEAVPVWVLAVAFADDLEAGAGGAGVGEFALVAGCGHTPRVWLLLIFLWCDFLWCGCRAGSVSSEHGSGGCEGGGGVASVWCQYGR